MILVIFRSFKDVLIKRDISRTGDRLHRRKQNDVTTRNPY